MKLVSITFAQAPRLPGVSTSAFSTIMCDKPNEGIRGWRVSIRGASVFFISPPGWKPGINVSQRDPAGPPTIIEVPRSNCYFTWHAEPQKDEKTGKMLDTTMATLDAVSKGRFDSPPFEEPKPVKKEPDADPPIDPKDLGDP